MSKRTCIELEESQAVPHSQPATDGAELLRQPHGTLLSLIGGRLRGAY